jgi:hypothetical protein
LQKLLSLSANIFWPLCGIAASLVPFITYFRLNWLEAAFDSLRYINSAGVIIVSALLIAASISAAFSRGKLSEFIITLNSLLIMSLFLFSATSFKALYHEIGFNSKITFTFIFVCTYFTLLFLIRKLCASVKTRGSVVFFCWFIFVFTSITTIYDFAQIKYLDSVQVKVPTKLTEKITKTEIEGLKRPNVYFIIPDAYAGDEYMRTELGFDNSQFIKKMKKLNFLVQENSLSPYNMTFLSVAAILNMDYIITDKSEAYISRDEFFPAMMQTAKVPLAVKEFTQLGYDFWHFGNIWAQCDPTHVKCYGVNYQQLLSYELRGLLNSTPFPWFEALFSTRNINYFDNSFLDFLEQYKLNDKPSFFFVHHLAPHPPYIFNSDCSIKNSNEIEFDEWQPNARIDYLDNLQCTNRKLASIENWVSLNDPSAIIVVTGDHGSAFGGIEGRDERLRTLTMARFPDNCDITNVRQANAINMMRLALSCAKEEAPKLLPNKSFIGGYDASISSVKAAY